MEKEQSLSESLKKELMGQTKELNEKDLLCIARLIQSFIFAEDMFYGCNYCKYHEECSKSFLTRNQLMHSDVITTKLQCLTGIDLEVGVSNLETKFRKVKFKTLK